MIDGPRDRRQAPPEDGGRLFDEQAASFEARAGIPPEALEAATREIPRIVTLGPSDLAIEIGAGTGVFSRALSPLVGVWVALDSSRAMLEELRAHIPHAKQVDASRLVDPRGIEGVAFVHADAGSPWPVPDGAASLVFAARSLHWMPPEHAALEIERVLRPGGALLAAEVRRSAGGIRERLRAELHRRLALRGHVPRDGRKAIDEVVERCVARGARGIATIEVDRWRAASDVSSALAAWRGKRGLAGIDLPESEHGAILDELSVWASRTFGDTQGHIPDDEALVLRGALFA